VTEREVKEVLQMYTDWVAFSKKSTLGVDKFFKGVNMNKITKHSEMAKLRQKAATTLDPSSLRLLGKNSLNVLLSALLIAPLLKFCFF